MPSIAKIREILAVTENRPGMLGRVSSIIAKAGVNITAICACAEGGKAINLLKQKA